MFPHDGYDRPVIRSDLTPGVILRHNNPDGSTPPFADCVITKVEHDIVYLNRPMGWSDGKIHAEDFAVQIDTLLGLTRSSHFRTILLSSGKPYTMIGR